MRNLIDSGYSYLAEIPLSWEIRRNKNIFNEVSIKNHPSETVLSLYREYGVIPKDSRDDNHNVTSLDTSTYKLVDIDNLVINKMKAWQGSLAFSAFRGIISPAYLIYELEAKDIEVKYLNYLLRSAHYADEFARLSTGIRIGQWDLHSNDFLNTVVVIPPRNEQNDIAAFLDFHCEKIDSAIEVAKRSIEEYKAYRQSVIFEAVTKGLDPNTPMKNSGIEWLEDIPESWKTLRHKHFMTKVKDICEKWNQEDVISLTVNGVVKRDLENPKGKMPATFDGYQFVYPGNLLLCLFDIDVTPRCAGKIDDYGVTSPAYSQYALSEGFDVGYYFYYFIALDDQKLLLHLTPTMRSSFNADEFAKISAIAPPLSEQVEIAKYLDKACDEIDAAIIAKQSIIEELRAYKKSLIYEVVTGKREINVH